MTIDEKTLVKESMGCTEEDFVLSCNLKGFVGELSSADPLWWGKDISVQRQELLQKAADKLKAIKAGIVPILGQG